MFDYAYDKNKAVNQYKKYKEDGVVAIQGWGSGDTEALSGIDRRRQDPVHLRVVLRPPDRPEEDALQLLLRRPTTPRDCGRASST